METVVLWLPADAVKIEKHSKYEPAHFSSADYDTQDFLKCELRRNSVVVLYGPSLHQCLHYYSDHHKGGVCEIVIQSSKCMAGIKNPAHFLSELLELGFKLFGTKFMLRVN